jgi:hypothetical protein
MNGNRPGGQAERQINADDERYERPIKTGHDEIIGVLVKLPATTFA